MSDLSPEHTLLPSAPSLVPRRWRLLPPALLVLVVGLLIWGSWTFLSLLTQLFRDQGPLTEVEAQLKLRNPGFPGVGHTNYWGNRLLGLTLPVDQVRDLSPVQALHELFTLRCIGTEGNRDQGVLTDLTPLQGMALRQLVIHHAPVKDLTPLEGMSLKRLTLVDLAIDDLTPLQTLSNLRELNASSAGVRDLGPLAGLPLTILILSGTAVTDLTPLRKLPLRILDCHESLGIRDLTPLANLPLEMLTCEPDLLRDPANVAALKRIATLDSINGRPAAEVLAESGNRE